MQQRCPDESSEQRQFVTWCRHARIRVFSVPNGAHLTGSRHSNRWAHVNRLKGEGMVRGAPDLVFVDLAPIDGRPVAVEMKRALGARVSAQQKRVHKTMRGAGWHVIVAYGCAEAIAAASALGFNLGRRGANGSSCA